MIALGLVEITGLEMLLALHWLRRAHYVGATPSLELT